MSPSEMVTSIIAQLIKTEMDTERLVRILKLRFQSKPYFTNGMNEVRDMRTLCATLIEMVQGFPMPIVILLDGLDQCTDPSSIVRHLLEPTMHPASIADMMSMPTTGEQVHVKFVLIGRPNVHDIFTQLPYMSTIDMDVHNDIHKFVNQKVTDNEDLRRHAPRMIATMYRTLKECFDILVSTGLIRVLIT
jgi:hypothetical protein